MPPGHPLEYFTPSSLSSSPPHPSSSVPHPGPSSRVKSKNYTHHDYPTTPLPSRVNHLLFISSTRPPSPLSSTTPHTPSRARHPRHPSRVGWLHPHASSRVPQSDRHSDLPGRNATRCRYVAQGRILALALALVPTVLEPYLHLQHVVELATAGVNTGWSQQ